MKASAFQYVRPENLTEAIELLSGDPDGGAMAISGGQSLLVLMGLRFAMANTLVDISRLPELHRVSESADRVFLGAATTHAMIEDRKVPDPSSGLMPRVASKIAYRSVRNLGTIGGSMALADSAADWPACLIALDADIVIMGAHGERREKAEDFVRGPYETALLPAELVVGIDIPHRRTARWGTNKVARKSGAFADSLAVFVDSSNDGPARLALTGTASHARLLPRTSTYAHENRILDNADLRATILADLEDVDPLADAYRQRCHVATAMRAIAEARL